MTYGISGEGLDENVIVITRVGFFGRTFSDTSTLILEPIVIVVET